ncbi:hypothetical protein PILCRDRAFT_816535 [Piloderma croceum F 1598]|uniref:Uncharacterized protein n=1 Tax=Piloderma croceum (strain F 1598) TaxID=765440 RepID=A0A0C3BI57_PILCF|nr:hypothetical protein PILCRDRAFT_816535 [Piloderma croceum F 1598]
MDRSGDKCLYITNPFPRFTEASHHRKSISGSGDSRDTWEEPNDRGTRAEECQCQ